MTCWDHLGTPLNKHLSFGVPEVEERDKHSKPTEWNNSWKFPQSWERYGHPETEQQE
jgi:hypothetical protein